MIQLQHILSKLILLVCFAVTTFGLSAQNGQNPFEIPNRPIEHQTAPAEAEEEAATDNNPFEVTQSEAISNTPVEIAPPSTPSTTSDTNPFEVEPVEASPEPAIPTAPSTDNPFEINRVSIDLNAPKEVAPSPVLQPQKIKSPVSTRNFHAGLVTFLLFFLAILVSLYSPVIKQLYKAFLNDNMLKLKHREQGSFLHLSLIMLYFYFFLNAGFFCYQLVKYQGWEGNSNSRLFFSCVLGLSAVFFIKHLFLRILGAVFPIEKEIKQYNFTIVVFNIILGITLLPLNLLIAYGPSDLPKYLIYSTLIIIALIYGFRIIRSLLIGSRYISSHKFHFFMYLCTVEIAPTLILVKLLLFTEG